MTLAYGTGVEIRGENPAPRREDKPQKSSPGLWRRSSGVVRKFLMGLPVPLLIFLFWDLGVRQGWTLPFDIRMSQVPAPLEVGRRLADIGFGGIINDPFSAQLAKHTWASTIRVLSGFGLAAAVAIPLGVLMGRSKLLSSLLDPTVNLVRPIPVTAWVPLALIIIGIGDRATIFLVFLAAFFPILLNTITSVHQVPTRLLEAAAMLGTRRGHELYKVVIPAAAPGIISGLRIALGLSWVILVVGETTGIRIGLGAMINEAQEVSKTDLIVAGMIFIGFMGFLTDRLLVGLVKTFSGRRPLFKEQS
jgi:NitT/TauT family transport system permease protein